MSACHEEPDVKVNGMGALAADLAGYLSEAGALVVDGGCVIDESDKAVRCRS
jgi:hypothetical protein